MTKKKKRSGIWKIILAILALFLVLCAGSVFYLYNKINDIGKYQDKFSYDYKTLIAENEGHEFKDCIFYDRDAMVFEYTVPMYYLYEIINEDSMAKKLGLPEELEIAKVGIEPRFEDKQIDIYLSVKYRNLINTCLLIKTDLSVSDDRRQAQLSFNDFFVIDENVTEHLRESVQLEKGTVLFTHRFPVFVPYYRMPDYRPEHIHDLTYDGENICAKYDIAGAMKDYLAETEYNEDPFDVCMEKIDLEVRMNSIAHSN